MPKLGHVRCTPFYYRDGTKVVPSCILTNDLGALLQDKTSKNAALESFMEVKSSLAFIRNKIEVKA